MVVFFAKAGAGVRKDMRCIVAQNSNQHLVISIQPLNRQVRQENSFNSWNNSAGFRIAEIAHSAPFPPMDVQGLNASANC